MCKQSFSVFHTRHRLTCCKSTKRNHLLIYNHVTTVGTNTAGVDYLFIHVYLLSHYQSSVSTGHRCCKLQVQQTNLRLTDAQRQRVKLALPKPPIHLLWKYFCLRTDHKDMEYINVLNLLTANYIASDSGINGRCKCCYSLNTAELVNTLATNLHSHNVDKITIGSCRRQFVKRNM